MPVESDMSSPSFELKSEILRAGAGAGKTTRLVQEFVRVYDLFKKETQKPPRIIVTTFTRKATHELKERLLQKALERKDADLFSYITQKSKVHISTIHGVLTLFLRHHGFHIGLSPDFKIISEAEDTVLRKKILKRILSQNPHFLDLFEDYKVAELLLAMDKAAEYFLLTPDLVPLDRATMQSDCEKLFADGCEELINIAQKIEGEGAPDNWLEYLRVFRRLRQSNWKDFFTAFSELKDLIEQAGSKPRFSQAKPVFNPELNTAWDEKIKEIKKWVQDPFYDPLLWDKWFAHQKLFGDMGRAFLKELIETKIKNSQLRMADLEFISAVLLQQKPDAGAHFASEWNYWMIDEYQDTSPLQVHLLKNLIGDRPQFVVGDPQQSIYLFRGARSEVFTDKLEEFLRAQSVVSEKLDNYRSRAPVLHLINDVFTKMSSQFKSMVPQKDWESPFVPCELLIAETEKEDKQEKINFELHLALHKITEFINAGVAPEKIAVLSRTNRLLEQLGVLAREKGIAYQQPNASGYFLKREIKDAAAILKFLLNPHADDQLVACLRSPWFLMQDVDLVASAQKKTSSLWKSLLMSYKSGEFTDPGSNAIMKYLVSYLEKAREQGISQTLVEILIQRGLFDLSENIDPSGRREANLWKFVNTIKEKERSGAFHYLEFLNEIESLIQSADEGEAAPVIEPRRVNFMTVHAAKGLQFDHLILVGLSQDQKKSSSPLWSYNENKKCWSLALRGGEDQSWIYSPQTREQTLLQQQKENLESERVLYVAMTRAKETITLVMKSDFRTSSWSQKLFFDFTEGDHVSENYTYRVKRFKDIPTYQLNVTAAEKQERPLLPQKFSALKVEPLKSASVTSMIDQTPSGPTEGTQTFEVIKKSQFGTDLHRVFESLKYIDFEEVSSLYKDQSLQEVLTYIKALNSPPMFSLINEGHVEYGFEILHQSQIIRGQIDLWGQLGNEVWIVDYKTGSTQYLEKAFHQLSMYAEALHLIHQWKDDVKINLAVLYPLQKQVFTKVTTLKGKE